MHNIEKLADKIAEKHHYGQIRQNGDDYITHPRAVASIANSLYDPKENYGTSQPLGEELPIIKIVCLTHDILEHWGLAHTHEELKKEIQEAIICPPMVLECWMLALDVLNKNNYLSYMGHILTVKHHALARIVKLADLEHNLSNLPPGDLRDKYELAQFILIH
jgi:(p)ppGpp synthase/HD superfamily hydrolase